MLYATLKHKTQDLKELIALGVVDPVWIRNMDIFEKYHALRAQDVCRQCCHVFLAEDFGVSTETIKKVVQKLGGGKPLLK